MIQQTTDKTEVSEITEIRNKLKRKEQEVITLRCENDVLRHCWESTKKKVEKMAKEMMLLEKHLNP